MLFSIIRKIISDITGASLTGSHVATGRDLNSLPGRTTGFSGLVVRTVVFFRCNHVTSFSQWTATGSDI